MLRPSLALLCLFLSLPAFAVNPPKTFREALGAAIRLNPKTVSTDEMVESIHYMTLATKAAMLPSASANCSKDWTQGSTNYEGSLGKVPNRGSTTSCGVSVGMTLFDGGAGYYNFKSAKASEEAVAASYNTSDSMIPNTRGGLAQSTLSVYSSLVQAKEKLKFLEMMGDAFKVLAKLGSNDTLKDAQSNINQAILELAGAVDSLQEKFQYTVTLPPAEQMEDLDKTIASLQIPADAEKAIEIAMLKGPEVKRRNLNVEMADYSLKAIRAGFLPRVSVSANWSKLGAVDKIDPQYNYSGPSRTIGLSISIPLDLSSYFSYKAAAKNLQSKQSEKQAAVDSARFAIRSTYQTLKIKSDAYKVLSENYDHQFARLQKYIERINAGDTQGMNLTDLVNSSSNVIGTFMNREATQDSILNQVFSIQQTTGMLFEGLGMPGIE